MLIRLCGHFPSNPGHIDKLISIKGLPTEWIFRENVKFGGKELVKPWEVDVEENIPKDIRHLCEPTEIIEVFPPIAPGQPPVVDKRTIIGIRFNFMTQPGQELWEKIERFLDRMTPRDQKVPVPVMVAADHKMAFSPHVARRSARGSLELAATQDIPDVDLRIIPTEQAATTTQSTAATIIVNQVPPVAPVTQEAQTFACTQCPKVFTKKQALYMHTYKMHKKVKQPAGI